MNWSRPIPFPFPSPPARAQVFPPFVRPCRLFPFHVPVSPMYLPCIIRCLSCWVWGATLAHCPRHWKDIQLRSALRKSH